MNNRARKTAKQRREMTPQLYVRVTNEYGNTSVYPLRFLVPTERAAYLARATSPL